MFVRNFYIRVVNKDASEARQISVGRIVIFANGIIWVLLAAYFSTTSTKLFDLLLIVSASIAF